MKSKYLQGQINNFVAPTFQLERQKGGKGGEWDCKRNQSEIAHTNSYFMLHIKKKKNELKMKLQKALKIIHSLPTHKKRPIAQWFWTKPKTSLNQPAVLQVQWIVVINNKNEQMKTKNLKTTSRLRQCTAPTNLH